MTNEERKYIIVTKYLNMVFETLEFEDRGDWIGFFDDEEIILGTTKPVETESIWFYWRLPFEHIIESFEMEDEEFKDMLNLYIEKKFGIKIDKIM